MAFMNDVMNKDKWALTKNQVNTIHWPNLPECSIAKLWPIARGNPAIMKYMPDTWNEEKCERQYVVNIINTLHPGFLYNWKVGAQVQRKALKDAKKHKIPQIRMHDDWINALFEADPVGRKSF